LPLMAAAMARLRTFLIHHRALAIWLVVLALAMKALVPAGYMIGSDTRTLTIEICDGQGHHQLGQIVVQQPAKAGHSQNDHGKGDSTCPYGALGHAGLAGADPVLLAFALAFILALGFAPIKTRHVRRAHYLRPPLRGPPVLA